MRRAGGQSAPRALLVSGVSDLPVRQLQRRVGPGYSRAEVTYEARKLRRQTQGANAAHSEILGVQGTRFISLRMSAASQADRAEVTITAQPAS